MKYLLILLLGSTAQAQWDQFAADTQMMISMQQNNPEQFEQFKENYRQAEEKLAKDMRDIDMKVEEEAIISEVEMYIKTTYTIPWRVQKRYNDFFKKYGRNVEIPEEMRHYYDAILKKSVRKTANKIKNTQKSKEIDPI